MSNVSVGKPAVAGAIYCAAAGSTLPTDASSALDAAFECLGYVSEDGLVNNNSMSVENVKAWGGDIVLTPTTEKPDTFQFTLIEALNDEVLKAVYGSSNVSGALATGLTVRANNNEVPACAWVVDMLLDGGSVLKRIVIESGQVTEIGEITYKDDTAIGYQLTVTAFPGSTNFGGDTHKEYLKNAS